MACDADALIDYLADFGGQRPIDAILCPFAGPNGADMGLVVVGLLFIGGMGMALTIKNRHPGPILVAGMLSAGLFATALPGGAAKIFALVLVMGIAGVGLILYKRARTSL